MATVTGFTAARMLEIENETIVDGNVVGNDLILTTREGTNINAGNVRGPQGDEGPIGEVSLATLNAAIASEANARDAAIAAFPGWKHVDFVEVSGASTFTIDILPSTYRLIKVFMSLSVSGAASAINAQVNGDGTSNLHRYSYHQMLDNALTPATTDSTVWRLGIGNVSFASNFELVINNADAASGLPWQCVNTVFATGTTNVRTNISSGRLTSTRLLSSLVITPSAGTMTGYAICQGYKLP